MPPKRRPTHQNSPVVKKIKILIPGGDELKSFLLSTIQLVTNLRDDSNRIISKEFFKLPSKKLYPDYYDLVEEPVSLNEIKTKIINNKYSSSTEFLDDFKLMNKNAKTYNDASSAIALDSEFILNFVQDQVKQFNGEDVSVEDYSSDLKNLLQQCISYKPYKRQRISPPFMDDVDGEMYPDYYDIIKKGMSFNTILSNLPDYGKNLEKFLEDINLIWFNAQTYNDEASLIYQDSVKLCEYFYKKFGEFVEKNDIELKYEIPEPVIKPIEPVAEKKKRGRPRLDSVAPQDLPPLELDDEDNDDDNDELNDDDNDVDADEVQLDLNGVDEPKPISLSSLNTIKQENGINRFIGYKRFVPKSQHDVFKNFIKSITLSSSRNLYRKSSLQDTKTGQFILSLEKDKPELQKIFQSFATEFFEYKFLKDDLCSTNFTLNLKNVNTIQISTMLNMFKIGSQKFEQVMFFNGEKISASPSVYEFDTDELSDEDKLSQSKFDINLLPGLNSLEFVVKVGPIILIDRNGKLPSRHATNPNNENNYITERCCIWVNVDQF